MSDLIRKYLASVYCVNFLYFCDYPIEKGHYNYNRQILFKPWKIRRTNILEMQLVKLELYLIDEIIDWSSCRDIWLCIIKFYPSTVHERCANTVHSHIRSKCSLELIKVKKNGILIDFRHPGFSAIDSARSLGKYLHPYSIVV